MHKHGEAFHRGWAWRIKQRGGGAGNEEIASRKNCTFMDYAQKLRTVLAGGCCR